jgi:hypothetical protein
MTTINSLGDFLQALDDNPAWRDAVRARILSEELLQMPTRFEALMERMERFAGQVAGFVEEQKQFNDRVDNFMLLTNTRMGRIESDISVTKGGHVRTMLMDRLPDLAETLESNLIRTVPREELVRMARTISDATPDDLRSFRRADLVVQVAKGQDSSYLTVEASWTASQRDSDRAVRNADFLTETTGLSAIPVIASVRNTREVADLIESGALRWYRIEERDVQVE